MGYGLVRTERFRLGGHSSGSDFYHNVRAHREGEVTRMQRTITRVVSGMFLLGAVAVFHDAQAADETPATKWKNVWGMPDCVYVCDLSSNWCQRDPDNCDCDC